MKYNTTTLVRRVRTLVAFRKLTTITLDKVYFYTLKVLLIVKNDNKLAFITKCPGIKMTSGFLGSPIV